MNKSFLFRFINCVMIDDEDDGDSDDDDVDNVLNCE